MSKLKNKDAERLNPCLKEQEQSYKCLNDNDFVQEKCRAYFDNYNECKKFWSKVSKDRRSKGIVPHLPDVEERAEIKSSYLGKNK